MKNLIKKESTLYKKARAANAPAFEKQRNEFLETIVNSKPRFNVRVTVTQKPF